MTNPTLERAARALFDSYMSLAYTKADADFPTPDVVEEIWQEGRDGFIQSARAVLMAVREPGIEASREGMRGLALRSPTVTWQCMIDAILNDGEGE